MTNLAYLYYMEFTSLSILSFEFLGPMRLGKLSITCWQIRKQEIKRFIVYLEDY